MKKKRMFLAACLVASATWASAQVRVTGTVVSGDDGQPVVGASVIVPGTKVGVVSDANGHFTLTVPHGNNKLRISSVGMEPQEVTAQNGVKVTLQPNSRNLDELVVVGYGSGQKMGTVVGSLSKIGPEKLESLPTANALDALQGAVPGLTILNNTGDPGDASYGIYVRGMGSLGAGTDPLFVVDGSQASSDILKSLNPNDIASITVLKDASATSIYGSRAANGVIYITTKKGSSGKATVQLSQTYGWSSLARRIGNPMNASELLDWQKKYGIISDAYYTKYKELGNDWDWQDYFFSKSAPVSETNFSIRGGSDKINYFTSASYYKENGLLPSSEFERYTLRSNIDARPLSWLHYGLNLNVSYKKSQKSTYAFQGSNYSTGPIMGVEWYAPYWETPYNEDGSRKDQIPGFNFYSLYYIEAKNPHPSNELQTNSSAFIELTPIKGLTLRSQLGVEAADQRSTSKRLASFMQGSTPFHKESFTRTSIFTLTNTAEYKFSLNDDNNFTFLLGQEGVKASSYGFSGRTEGQSDDRLDMMNNGTKANLGNTTDSAYDYAFLSFFGRADYALQNKYFANVTVRNDQSSRFGKDNRSAWFVSGGLMWNLKKENFLESAGWLTGLQLRASVGSTGNAAIGNYDRLALTGTTQYNGTPGWYVSSAGNDKLGWEKTVQTNVGVNASFFNRINVDLNYYIRNTSDMLMEIPVQYTTGWGSYTTNVGSMQNKGIELSFSADVVKTRDLTVTFRTNYSFNKNKITKLFYGLDEWAMPNYLTAYVIGKSINFYMPIYAGVDKEDGKPMWYKKGFNGGVQHEYNQESMTKTFDQSALLQDTGKKMQAPHVGGFGLTASYKGLILNADFSYVLGKYLINNDQFFAENPARFAANGYNQSRDVLRAWENPGDLTDIPAVTEPRQFDTHLLENASFLRLKNLSLSYDLPKAWMAATGFIQNFRVTLTGRNLLTATKYRGADPEIDSNLTYGAYPSTRQFSIGAEITF